MRKSNVEQNVCHDGKQLPYIRVVYVKGKRKLVQPKEKLFPDGKGGSQFAYNRRS